MKFGTHIDENTGKVNHGHLSFNDGKKFMISAEECKEFEDKLKLAKAEGKFLDQQAKDQSIKALEQAFDWWQTDFAGKIRNYPSEHLENFPMNEIAQALALLKETCARDEVIACLDRLEAKEKKQ